MSLGTLGKYELVHRIAAGGMAELFVARTRGLVGERLVVVKRLLPEHASKTEYLKMFEDEARIAAAVNHPNVVQMYDYGTDSGWHYLAMEYLHGEDVRTIVKMFRARHERIPLPQAVAIVAGLCAGLHSVHDARGIDGTPLSVVHRDVSPQNVFLTFEGGIKVVDFGIAQAENRLSQTRHGALKGKVPYMSPEQLRGEKVDRRTDIYATGVLLYELTVGTRPYLVPPGGGEFALMMAISRGQVRRPGDVDPSYPPALEQIVMKAMSRDLRTRYKTAKEMQIDLEAYAHENGMILSSLSLAAFMESVFGARVEAWRHAIDKGQDLAALVVAVEEERANTGVHEQSEVEVEAPAQVSSEEQLPDLSRAGIEVTDRRAGGARVISLAGRLTEGFEGAALGRALSGLVVLDLAGVERITSYGVREWLEMLEAARGNAQLFFCRCSDAVVSQLAMIRGFAGEGRVVSFMAPYLCTTCGVSALRALDCERDAAALAGRRAPPGTCPSCGGETKFDDDADVLSFAAPHLHGSLPPEIRAAADALVASSRAPEAIEKLVTGSVTRVRLRTELGQAQRWNRVFDGIEGQLVLDFQDARGATPDGVRALVRALHSLGSEVTSVEVNGAFPSLAEAIVTGKPARVTVCSVLVEGHCETCKVQRTATVALSTLRAAHDRGEEPTFPCRRCGSPLTVSSPAAVMRAVAPTDSLSASARPRGAKSEPPKTPSIKAPPVVVHRRTRKLAVSVVGALALAATFATFGLWRTRSRPHPTTAAAAAVAPPAAQPASTASSTSVSVDAVPPWAQAPFAVEGNDVFLVGRGLADREDRALAAARVDAIGVLVQNVLARLPDGAPKRFAAKRTDQDAPDAVAERYVRQVGAMATPERVDVKMRSSERGIEALARYRMPESALRDVVATYGRAVELDGVLVASAFPLFPAKDDSLVVVDVAADSPGARAKVLPGDVVVRVDGRTLSSPAGLDVLASSERPHALDFEGGGVKRHLSLSRGGTRE